MFYKTCELPQNRMTYREEECNHVKADITCHGLDKYNEHGYDAFKDN